LAKLQSLSIFLAALQPVLQAFGTLAGSPILLTALSRLPDLRVNLSIAGSGR